MLEQEVLGILARRRYPEVFVKDLEKRKLQNSTLDMRFHIRDLLGRGDLTMLHSTSGNLLRITSKDK